MLVRGNRTRYNVSSSGDVSYYSIIIFSAILFGQAMNVFNPDMSAVLRFLTVCDTFLRGRGPRQPRPTKRQVGGCVCCVARMDIGTDASVSAAAIFDQCPDLPCLVGVGAAGWLIHWLTSADVLQQYLRRHETRDVGCAGYQHRRSTDTSLGGISHVVIYDRPRLATLQCFFELFPV